MWGPSGTGMSTHPGQENSPKWAEPGVKSSRSRVSPGLGFRPHELDLGQKPPRQVGRGPGRWGGAHPSPHLRVSPVL